MRFKKGARMNPLKAAWRGILRQPSRSLLTAIGVAVGVFSVLLIGTVSSLGAASVRSEIQSLGLTGITLRSEGQPLTEDAAAAAESLPSVKQAAPLLCRTAEISARGNTSSAMVWGVPPEIGRMVSLTLLSGRELDRSDLSAARRVCLLDRSLSEALALKGKVLGSALSLRLDGREENYTVVGIVETGGGLLQSLLGQEIPGFVYLPYTALQLDLGTRSFDRIAVRLKDSADPKRETKLLLRTLDHFFGQEGTTAADGFERYTDQLSGVLDAVTLLLSLIAGISLLVAGLSVMTVMLSSVRERTREVGIRKSIGASPGAIVAEFLAEALLLSLGGCLMGTTAGFLAGSAGCLLLGRAYSFPVRLFLICLLSSLLTGALFGAYPAKKAAALPPADALRRT